MKKTLLLCFIHGFKGDDDTFAGFPQHLQALLSHALPNISIAAVVYPTFETQGNLSDCVARVTEWLTNKVIGKGKDEVSNAQLASNVPTVDLEVSNGTVSPTVEPSVRTVLVGHSMGGIVAAEVALGIVSEKPLQPEDKHSSATTASSGGTTMMFPYIQGVLAFDTPYLGISPGVVAHGAEGQWKMGKSAYDAFQGATGLFGANTGAAADTAIAVDASRGIQAATAASHTEVAAAPAWQRWGKYALFAGAAGALTAGGAAAYMKRDDITQGWTWVGSHLEFVGCLARGEELKQRLASVTALENKYGFGFADLYTCLGRAVETKTSMSSQAFGEDRTFCNLPKSELKRYFHKAVNDATNLEVMAHMYMFVPKKNPGYYSMSDLAKELISGWVEQKWYDTATTGDVPDEVLEDDMSIDEPEMTKHA